MDLYITSLLLGAIGLAVMALGGFGHRGNGGRGGHGSHSGQGGHGPQAGHAAHSAHGATAGGRSTANAPTANAHAAAGPAHGARDAAANALWAIASPRFLFSLALGAGVVGALLRPLLGGPILFAAAVVGGVAFERVIVSPLWNFAMRFASTPASMLESAVADEATAVTSFDANGQGIVSVEVDGQIVQILATLQPDDRALGGSRIRAGQRVRIEDVDAEKNCCTVSLI
jgi:hypothetical protein